MIKLIDLLTEGKLGDCYEVSGRFIMNKMGATKDEPYKLVHGMVSGQGKLEGLRYGHAWIEYGNVVIDNSNGKERNYPKELYYVVGNIIPKETIYYTPTEAVKRIAKYKHWGPWDMNGDTVQIKEQLPIKKDEIGKKKIKVDSDTLNKIANL